APHVADAQWPRGELDQFVLAALEQQALRPASDADRYAWLRRVSFDLIGLPPTTDEIDAFVGDASPDAFERVVDRLLASPAFGGGWPLWGLALVGSGAQIGPANNVPAEHAWRYRDYVIRAFSADKPFDEFVREQIAGDLMTASNVSDRQDQYTATG